jgi:D-threo-aldose 1-dehydrogenase
VAAGVFNSGILAGGSTFDYLATPPALLERRRALEATRARYDVPLAAAAIQFPLRHPSETTVLVGARTPGEIREDMRLLQHPIPGELWLELDGSA